MTDLSAFVAAFAFDVLLVPGALVALGVWP